MQSWLYSVMLQSIEFDDIQLFQYILLHKSIDLQYGNFLLIKNILYFNKPHFLELLIKLNYKLPEKSNYFIPYIITNYNTLYPLIQQLTE